jgi:hypothetical protein
MVRITTAAAQPAGYHVGAAVALPDSAIEVLAHGRFRSSILRRAGSPSDARLIAAAEQLYPSQDVIIASAAMADERNRLLGTSSGVSVSKLEVTQRAAGLPVDRWWLDSIDETWIPFAVTAGAVNYYRCRLHDYAAGRGLFGFGATKSADHGSLSYTARAVASAERGAARVVKLELRWTYWCGSLCAMEFVHTRRVFFDASGKVIRIEGDGRPTVIVS